MSGLNKPAISGHHVQNTASTHTICLPTFASQGCVSGERARVTDRPVESAMIMVQGRWKWGLCNRPQQGWSNATFWQGWAIHRVNCRGCHGPVPESSRQSAMHALGPVSTRFYARRPNRATGCNHPLLSRLCSSQARYKALFELACALSASCAKSGQPTACFFSMHI